MSLSDSGDDELPNPEDDAHPRCCACRQFLSWATRRLGSDFLSAMGLSHPDLVQCDFNHPWEVAKKICGGSATGVSEPSRLACRCRRAMRSISSCVSPVRIIR